MSGSACSSACGFCGRCSSVGEDDQPLGGSSRPTLKAFDAIRDLRIAVATATTALEVSALLQQIQQIEVSASDAWRFAAERQDALQTRLTA